MIRVVLLHFPATSATAVAECIPQTPPVPDFMTMQGPLVKNNGDAGISTMALFRCADAMEEEATEYLAKRYATYSGIAGLELVVEEWIDADLALHLLEESESIGMAIEMFSLNF